MVADKSEVTHVGSAAIRALDWFQFKKLVALLFEQEGFAVQRFGGAHADGGIDLTATKDGITFGVFCKHWKAWQASVEEVRAFFAALQDGRFSNGFLIALQGCTPEADDFARGNGIDLMDEPLLLDNLEAVNWRENFAFLRLLHDRRKICPKCESEMVVRAKNTAKGGQQWWACSNSSQCSYTAA